MRRPIDKFPPPAHTTLVRVEHTSGRGGFVWLALRTSWLAGEGAAASELCEGAYENRRVEETVQQGVAERDGVGAAPGW